MREPDEWQALELGPAVQLLLGWRTGRRGLTARPVALGAETAQEMLTACRETAGRLGRSERRPYLGLPALEADEYLSVPLGEAPEDYEEALGQAGLLLGEEAAAASILIQLVRGAFENDDFLTRDELRRGTWLFYVVVAESGDDGVLGFVRQYNPQRGFRTGRLLTAYHDALSRFDDPLFNFDLDFDIVIDQDEVVVLSTTAFDRVFADLNVVAAQVPDQVARLNASLGVHLTAGSAQFLEANCQSRATLARRLRRIAQEIHLGAITLETLTDALRRHNLPDDRFGRGPELDLQNAEDVVVFLDILEQLYFEADFTAEPRRADRYSRRAN